MSNSKLYAFYFSPTGGTKKVLDIFLGEWDCEKILIDLSDRNTDMSKYSFDKDDICIAAVPSFGGRVPQLVIPLLSKLKGAGAGAVPIVSYGNRAFDDTLLELSDTLSKSGFVCFAAMAAVTRHSVVPKFGEGRPDSEDTTQIKEFSRKCRDTSDKVHKISVPGNSLYRKLQPVPIIPKADKTCNGCGVCSEKCPTGAIDKDDPRKPNKNSCISCMRCVSVCPQKCRHIDPLLLKAAEMGLSKKCSERKDNFFAV